MKVTEYGQGTEHGYSVCAVLADGEPEVANVVVNTQSQQMSMNGNAAYYGNNNNSYQTGISPGEMMLWMYLMRPNYSYYHSPYGYGHYGYGYSYRPVVRYDSYRSRSVIHTTTTKTYSRPTQSSTKLRSPNASNHSAKATQRTSNFNNATKSQKSFQKTAPSSGPRNTSGFGNKSNSSPSKSSNVSRPNSSPSKSSGFGSSSRSSKSSGSSSRSSSGSRRR